MWSQLHVTLGMHLTTPFPSPADPQANQFPARVRRALVTNNHAVTTATASASHPPSLEQARRAHVRRRSERHVLHGLRWQLQPGHGQLRVLRRRAPVRRPRACQAVPQLNECPGPTPSTVNGGVLRTSMRNTPTT